MTIAALTLLVGVVAQVLIWVVIAWSLLSFFLSPYHPVRQALARIVEPLLNPIRRIMPATGSIDFSPLILILLVWLVSRLLTGVLISLS
jgi:YggT family protein